MTKFFFHILYLKIVNQLIFTVDPKESYDIARQYKAIQTKNLTNQNGCLEKKKNIPHTPPPLHAVCWVAT